MTPDDSSSIFLEEDIVNMINEANLIVRQTNIVTKHIRMKFRRASIAPIPISTLKKVRSYLTKFIIRLLTLR